MMWSNVSRFSVVVSRIEFPFAASLDHTACTGVEGAASRRATGRVSIQCSFYCNYCKSSTKRCPTSQPS
jgi:hypothetical protein